MTIQHQEKDPIAILMREHRLALKRLSQLEQAVASMTEQGFTRNAFESLSEAIRFFDSQFRIHDRKEEQFLFPRLEKYKPGITRDYQAEHRELWSAFNQLLSCVQDVEDGRLRGSSRQELVETAKQIVGLLRTHINNENTFLFPQAKQALSPLEYKEFGEKVAAEEIMA